MPAPPSVAAVPLSNIVAIELRRQQLKLATRRVCHLAGISTSTYYRMLNAPGSGRLVSIERLARAVQAFELNGQRHAG
jgi:hypothetical protein